MATGITKGEQQTADSISVGDLFQEPSPLPDGNEAVELTYVNKASVSEIILPMKRSFVRLKRGQEPIATNGLPTNSLVLDDNFFALNQLVAQREKVQLFYLDPPYGTGFDFQSRDLEHAYKDSMGTASYIEFMRRRLILMREAMADDGSIYVLSVVRTFGAD